MKATDYPVLVIWSEADGAYLANVIGLPGCLADGTTPEEAVANSQLVIQEWLETARELGREIPEPTDDAAFQKELTELASAERDAFEKAVQTAVKEHFARKERAERHSPLMFYYRKVAEVV
jgi:predicted RNase H-like HicB family nuclease